MTQMAPPSRFREPQPSRDLRSLKVNMRSPVSATTSELVMGDEINRHRYISIARMRDAVRIQVGNALGGKLDMDIPVSRAAMYIAHGKGNIPSTFGINDVRDAIIVLVNDVYKNGIVDDDKKIKNLSEFTDTLPMAWSQIAICRMVRAMAHYEIQAALTA